MPAKSQQQREWAFAVKGPAWAKKHHFDNKGKLPKYVNKKEQIRKAAVAANQKRT